MPRPKPEGETKSFQFRMTVEETARWLELYQRAKDRTGGYIKDTDFNRLLLGLKEDPKAVTEKDRIYFQQAGLEDKAKLIGRVTSPRPHIREVSPKIKRK